MIFERGNVFQMIGKTDLILATGNSVVKMDGALVMGKGAAKELLSHFPECDKTFGTMAARNDRYGLVFTRVNDQDVGLFQTKMHWRDKSNLRLIRHSTIKLFAHILSSKPDRVDLVFPGIGFGGLRVSDVYEIIKYLPNNVHVWRKDE